jgi:hypothetical protein
MTGLNIIINGDGAWPDITAKRAEGKLIDLMDDPHAKWSLACLPRGTQGGNPTVTARFDLPDGRVILTQTTLKLLKSAVRAFEAAHGPVDA